MNFGVFYITSIVLSIAGLAALWEFGIKPLQLDNFRDSLFLVRDKLYLLAREGGIEHDAPAYRAVELLINSMIQYAHRFTFLSFLLSMHWREKHPQQIDHAANLLAAIDTVGDHRVREELRAIVVQATRLLPNYIGKSSLAFMALSGGYLLLRAASPRVASGKDAAVRTFTSDAYESAKTERYAHV